MKIYSKLLIGMFAWMFFAGCHGKFMRPSVDNNSIFKRIDSLINDWHVRDQFHGGIVVSKDGAVLYENYKGIADRTWNLPVGPHVKFDIASLNKSMIAALIMKAVEEGKINLTDSLADKLGAFSFNDSFDSAITIHHLLCHTSGLADYDQVAEDLKADHFQKLKRLRFTNEAYVDFISQLPVAAAPGTTFHYSNFGYHLLAIILEETYQQPFSEILQEKLTNPLGLHQTVSTEKNEQIISHLAKAYQFDEENEEWLENAFIDLSLGRRIFSTASDLNRWAIVMDNPGYLSKASLELIKTNHLQGITDQIQYGYGWVLVEPGKESKMGDLGINKPYLIHGGSTEGFKSMLINIESGTYVISFLSNVGDRTNELELAKNIVQIITN